MRQNFWGVFVCIWFFNLKRNKNCFMPELEHHQKMLFGNENHLSIHGAQPRGWKLMEKNISFFLINNLLPFHFVKLTGIFLIINVSTDVSVCFFFVFEETTNNPSSIEKVERRSFSFYHDQTTITTNNNKFWLFFLFLFI